MAEITDGQRPGPGRAGLTIVFRQKDLAGIKGNKIKNTGGGGRSPTRRANCARVEGTRAFHFLCLSLSLLGGLTMPEWKGRVPLTRSHCERIT
ncbi:hypothetical protein EVAR_95592_1 [Eumeta japonica]|uniref:Uncharacterized protein n=1 Tax=Eumeta variegata TaxID=151549 RepID=A0A4C1VK52_EUMVA|nr:hypothetical protein EVAR_95592_1 [Eumeta japonica]